ncbi:MAG: hypothetical protein M0R47_18890 [Methylobacter sp.]|uniref:hypothetical protein n=1 Tax=Methylobacter sp. TaxID=2051955 RepID=UPI0025D9A58F|nr:hypothetical protein [Methylobacter sp.]MCK9622588.1 hypothetical protein [Methylobacter sp.]
MTSEIINGAFAIGGALIGVIGTWLIALQGKEKQRITLLVSPHSKLLDVNDIAKSDVQITYKGTPINDLGAGEFAAQNTGTKALEEIEIDVTQALDSPLLDFEISSKNFTAPENFIEIEQKGDGVYKVKIKYLNPKDRVVFIYRISGSEKPGISIRKLGVDVEMRQEVITGIPDIYAEIFFSLIETMPIPGYSWLLSKMNKPYRLYLEAKRKNA